MNIVKCNCYYNVQFFGLFVLYKLLNPSIIICNNNTSLAKTKAYECFNAGYKPLPMLTAISDSYICNTVYLMYFFTVCQECLRIINKVGSHIDTFIELLTTTTY